MSRAPALLLSGLLAAAACSAPGGEEAPAPGASVPAPPAARGGGIACWSAAPGEGAQGIAFTDVTEAQGLVAPLSGMRGHAAAWGDANGDLLPDLFVGTFADRPPEDYRLRGADGPSPDRLLLETAQGFRADPGFPAAYGRSSGAAFADLDGDGDLDLVVSRNVKDVERGDRPTEILRNEGDGAFVPVADPGLPEGLVGRSVGVLDFDADGLLDLFVAEDRYSGGGSVLARNLGGLTFEDATAAAGLPPDVHGLGVGVSDLTGDGRADLFVAGSNRLFVAAGDGTFREADGSVFRWQTFGGEDDVSGVSAADLNRDGLLDLVLGHHFNSTLSHGTRVPVRVYLNRGADGRGDPVFEDVTEASGLAPLSTKAPHVEIADLDNDGWPDILTTASAAGGTRPAVFRGLGLEAGVPRFAVPEGLGSPQYWVTGPTADVDLDGRQDVLLVEWEPGLPSLLLRNVSASGNWVSVSVTPEEGGGIGARVEVYEAGRLGQPSALLGARDIVASQGYAAGSPPIAHFGLGDVAAVDLRVTLPGGRTLEAVRVEANRHVRLPDGCG